MVATMFSAAPQHLLFHHHHHHHRCCSSSTTITTTKSSQFSPQSNLSSTCLPRPTPVFISQSSLQTPDSPLASQPDPTSPYIQNVPDDLTQFRGCKTCGKEEIEKGCNGEERIQGGIATVPGFGWWPIKAYRPCPGFVASGGRYRRRGQNMDEVAFGKERVDAVGSIDKEQTR